MVIEWLLVYYVDFITPDHFQVITQFHQKCQLVPFIMVG